MKGDLSKLGEPGKRTHLDLTLGEDLDGDGIPDAWERALLAALGGNRTLCAHFFACDRNLGLCRAIFHRT
jgi:hypothetical protein